MKKPNLQKKRKKGRKTYIDLCQDLMFKTFFSKNEDILLSLVQSFIFDPKNKLIESLSLENPEVLQTEFELEKDPKAKRMKARRAKKGQKSAKPQSLSQPSSASLGDSAIYPDSYGAKQIALDLLVKLNTGERVNIELQSLPQECFFERILFYWKRMYGRDLQKRDHYNRLKPAYSLVFTNFSLFEGLSKDFLNSFSIRSDKPPHFLPTKHYKTIVVDLKLFSKQLGKNPKNLVDMMHLWCYFISKSASLTKSDFKILNQHEVFKVAKDVLTSLSIESDLRFQEIQREKAIRDSFSFTKDATENALKRGRLEGREEGLQKGLQKGMQAVALKMLKAKVEISFIAKMTGLSEAEIKKLN